jgi:hypothetical protein
MAFYFTFAQNDRLQAGQYFLRRRKAGAPLPATHLPPNPD